MNKPDNPRRALGKGLSALLPTRPPSPLAEVPGDAAGVAGASARATSLARGMSPTGAPRKNTALARCSAVCTFRSTPRISWARGM